MLPIRWSASALEDLDNVIEYIAAHDLQAALSIFEQIESSLLPVSEHPHLYRQGRVFATREIVVHPNYLVVYEVLQDSVEVRAVLHARRNYP